MVNEGMPREGMIQQQGAIDEPMVPAIGEVSRGDVVLGDVNPEA